MGRIRLEELSVVEVERIMRCVAENRHIPAGLGRKLAAMSRVAIRGIRETERRAQTQTFGKYRNSFPAVARQICAIFGAEDSELAACFDVEPATIRAWRSKYPDFHNGLRNGRREFALCGGQPAQYRRWLHPFLADGICSVFNASDIDLARCFGVDPSTVTAWRRCHPEFGEAVRCGRFVGSGQARKVVEAVEHSLDGTTEDSGVQGGGR